MMNNASTTQSALAKGMLQSIRERVYKHSGICLEDGKENLIESRLRRRLRALDMQDPMAYLDYLDATPAEYEHFVNVFTTNETSFFRTVRVWRYIEETLLREWAEDSTKVRHAWSAASSTGEEAFSLAMACENFNRERKEPLRVKIAASDIATDVIARAKRANFSGRTINRLKASRPDYLLSYFIKQGEEYRLRPGVSSLVQFRQHNLFKNPPHNGHYDLVMLRNVLIYFSNADQEKVLANIHRALKPGGVLIVGESESLANLSTAFEYCQPLIYKKKG